MMEEAIDQIILSCELHLLMPETALKSELNEAVKLDPLSLNLDAMVTIAGVVVVHGSKPSGQACWSPIPRPRSGEDSERLGRDGSQVESLRSLHWLGDCINCGDGGLTKVGSASWLAEAAFCSGPVSIVIALSTKVATCALMLKGHWLAIASGSAA